jgi:putative colanic acid biosynthesis UDP-glucose lipid carrier transferase
LRGRSLEELGNVYSFPQGKKLHRYFVGWTDTSRAPAGYVENIFDFAGAALLLIALAPALLLIAAAIKLDSRGPVFFRQERHGRRGTIFRIYKFRTMHVLESGASAVQCRKDDPRLTRMGALLRKASLDELPQLLNVLCGEMALVGPRPHAISTDREFAPRVRRYGQRYTVKPGMTGLAQIRGYRGPTATLADMATRVASDLEYVRHRSLAFDLWILFKTIPAVLAGRNAF